MKSWKIEVDIKSDTDILIMLLLLMITKMMTILLLVLLLLTTNESNDCNNYDNNNVLTIEMIITKMKSGCALKWRKIKSSYMFYSPHFLFGEKNAP